MQAVALAAAGAPPGMAIGAASASTSGNSGSGVGNPSGVGSAVPQQKVNVYPGSNPGLGPGMGPGLGPGKGVSPEHGYAHPGHAYGHHAHGPGPAHRDGPGHALAHGHGQGKHSMPPHGQMSVFDVNGDSDVGMGVSMGPSMGIGMGIGPAHPNGESMIDGSVEGNNGPHLHLFVDSSANANAMEPNLEPTMPAEPPSPVVVVHLGTYIFPRTPFPYFFPPDYQLVGSATVRSIDKENTRDGVDEKGNEEGAEAEKMDIDRGDGGGVGEREREREKEKDGHAVGPQGTAIRETRVTILIPSGFLPLEKPARPRIWGGCGNNSGNTYGHPSPWHYQRPRRVYTDDSDVFLCALHAGWVTWSGARRARLEGRDLRVELRVVDGGHTRFVGGWGERCGAGVGVQRRQRRERGRGVVAGRVSGGGVEEDEEDDEDNDGRGLVSAGWGTGHDGSGIEVLDAEFVEVRLPMDSLGMLVAHVACLKAERYGERCSWTWFKESRSATTRV